MRKKRLLWQLYPTYLLITLAALLAVGWFTSYTLQQFHHEHVANDLEARSRLVAYRLAERFTLAERAYLDSLSKVLGKSTSTRITLILPDGRVVGDSEANPAAMENHAGRPEVAAALAGRTGTSIRYSHTVQQNMMYLALPVQERGKIVGIVRTSLPLSGVEQTLYAIQLRILMEGLAVALVAAVISLIISRRISRPLEEMKRGAERFAGGELARMLVVPDSEELAGLAEAMNQMAVQLDERIRTIVRQRNEQEAVLSSMVEGVLAVDTQGYIISLNQATARLFGMNVARIQGRSLLEAVRNADLLRFVDRALVTRKPVEGDIVLHDGEERYLQARSTTLRDAQGSEFGILIVLNDTTRLRRLETMRRDFVANVSHELKTPITAIHGFVETLLSGALQDPEDAERFLGIIARQADRLNAIINDLLTLSRIEQETEKVEIHLEFGRIKDVLQAAIQDCHASASERNIRIELVCEDGMAGKINSLLLEQGVVNLIDNAIKYSVPGSTMRIEARQNDTEITLSISDTGVGIAKEHLPRLFERFYRVDKARSRKLGGTGLGLAIVKHIALAHGGNVSVESIPEQGSTFTIHLPMLP